MNAALLTEIEKLRRATLGQLRDKHRELFHEDTRSHHREHIFRRLAWRLQALSEGDLPERARERAREIARDADLRLIAPKEFFTVAGQPVRITRSGRTPGEPDSRLPLPGVLLSREWKGRNILVEVLEDGFRYEHRYYRSLSAVAREVTGSSWNGLVFFGVRGTTDQQKDQKEKQEERARMQVADHAPHKPRRLRCAIYTRKSTEEGLDQDFNSLDAQREASEAFVLSQRHEGWSTLPERYDDGGFTGANMDRPALTRLLAAVEAGALDCVVVYKVDRLSRSLLDDRRQRASINASARRRLRVRACEERH